MDIALISALHETGLIEILTVKDNIYIENGQMPRLERIVRFYYEMDINIEGIEAITHMLDRLETVQKEVRTLKNKLRFYETTE